SMSRSVAVAVSVPAATTSRTWPRMGIVLRDSTALVTCCIRRATSLRRNSMRIVAPPRRWRVVVCELKGGPPAALFFCGVLAAEQRDQNGRNRSGEYCTRKSLRPAHHLFAPHGREPVDFG